MTKKPEKKLHRHNSIPCYFGGEDEGCAVCIRNRAYDEWEKYRNDIIEKDYIPKSEVVGMLEGMKFPIFQMKTTEQLNLKIDQKLSELRGK